MSFARLRALLGPESVDRDLDNVPRASPASVDALALVCRLAHDEGWKIRIEGHATWQEPDAPADLAVSTRALDSVLSVSPADLVASVQAGATMDEIRRALAEQGAWLAMDPPGRPERSIGSVVATGTAGALRHGFGPIRDHVVGCTVVTGDGRVVRAGGRVVKNVAGYDLTKLNVGGFGGFGIMAELHLRLRAVPERDVTLLHRGSRDALTSLARDLSAAGVTVAALELLSPALAADSDWVLAARLVGLGDALSPEIGRVTGLTTATGGGWEALASERTAGFWGLARRAALGGPTTIRLGVLADGLDEAIDLLGRELDEGLISAGGAVGLLRWTGDAPVERLRAVRRAAAAREVPLTVERAPWEVRHALGHFGAYREGVGVLVGGLRETFDPLHSFRVTLEGAERG